MNINYLNSFHLFKKAFIKTRREVWGRHVAKDLADAIKVHIEPERNIPEEARRCFMEEGEGYADEFCKMEIFDQTPNRLRKMIENGQKYARKKF